MNAKLTAYALNELPPDERAALEAEMETNSALRAEAEEMRKFCTLLHDKVAEADKTVLTTDQRVRVLREFTADTQPQPQPKKAERSISIWRHPAFLVPTAIAACTTVALLINLNQGRPPTAKEMEQMLERRLAERTKGKPSAEDVRVNFERSGKPATPSAQTPSPGKPELPPLVAATANAPTTLALDGSAQALPPMPEAPAPASPALLLPHSLEGIPASAGQPEAAGRPMVAANGAAPAMPAEAARLYGSIDEIPGPVSASASTTANAPQSTTRGIEIGASRPSDRFDFSQPKATGGYLTFNTPTTPTVPSTPSTAASGNATPMGVPSLSLNESSLGISTPPSDAILPEANTHGDAFMKGGVAIFGSDVTMSGKDSLAQVNSDAPVLGELSSAGRMIQGTAGVVKSGAGSLILSPAQGNAPIAGEPVHTYSGGTIITSTSVNGAAAAPSSRDGAMVGDVTLGNSFGLAGNESDRARMLKEVNGAWDAPVAQPVASSGIAPDSAAKAQLSRSVPMDAAKDNSGVTSIPPPAKPMESKPAGGPAPTTTPPLGATALAITFDNTSVTAGGVPAAPAAAPAPTLAPAPMTATTIAGKPVTDPYRAPDKSLKRLITADALPGVEEEELAERTKDLKQLQDKEERAGKLVRKFATRQAGGETYTPIYENPFLQVAQQPLSTFSIDVDTASYANVRRFLNKGQLPPADAVRLEELINYFPYTYEPPAEDGAPFSVTVDMAEAPWQPMHRLARIALKGREIRKERGAANFVFLVDVSGSMDSPDKLPLVKQSLRMLTEQLHDTDRVAIVTYAGESGVALTSTPGSERKKILRAIDALDAGGSTNGAGGIRMAYQQAAQNFIQEGVNRVILCTDGDFNVGISSPEELEKLIAEKAKSRVFLSVLGYGTGNLKDRTMETLADKGNGNYAYIDSLSEARKVLVDQMNATLVTIAKDVKIQVEFNPAQVAAYRLLGYENRALAKEDFNNDRKDAGEIGAGHTVTALYEIVPVGARLTSPDGRPAVDELKYAPKPAPAPAPRTEIASPATASVPGGSPSKETMTVKLRYKQPEGDKSQLLEVPVTDKGQTLDDAPQDFVFAVGVTGFGMMLRNSQYSAELTWDMIRGLALHGKGEDPMGYRGEFLQLIDKARGLKEGRE